MVVHKNSLGMGGNAMIEHERSYVFSIEDWEKKLSQGCLRPKYGVPDPIEDYYLNQKIRFRKKGHETNREFLFCRKDGSKAEGYRFEHEESVSEGIFNSMTDQAALVVKKHRYTIESDSAYKVTVDQITSPMKLAILEVEAKIESAYPVEENIAEKLFGLKWKPCPLSAFQLFRRKVGFCGGPSSGKTETAKLLSHVLNTKLGANSWHVTEFASTFIQKYKRTPTFNDQFFIWFGQKEREKSAETADIIVSDCPTFLSYIYTLWLNKEPLNPQTALAMSKIYKRVLFDVQEYTDIILLDVDSYVENGIRYQDEQDAQMIAGSIELFLRDHKIPFTRWSKQDDILNLVNSMFFVNS